jgi:alpha-N-acetylglucosamine transferase
MSDKEEIKKFIDNAPYVQIWHSKWWAYPSTGDDPKTCPMLQAMLSIEHKGGYIVFIREDKKDA